MNATRNTMILLAVAGLAFAAGRANLFSDSAALAQQPPAKDKPKDKPSITAPPPEMDAKMEAMMKASMPGEHHKALEPAIGEFDTVVHFAMEPGAPMMESKGTVKREWVLDKHYIRETVEAGGMDDQPFKGLGYFGYNNVDGQYEFIWMENMSTAIMFETGTYDAGKKIMTMHSSHRDPASGRVITGWGTWDLSNPDRQTVVGYAFDENGKEFKNFDGVFDRKKK